MYSRYSGIIAAVMFAFLPAVAGVSNEIVPDMFTLMCSLAAVLALLKYIRGMAKGIRSYALLSASGFFAFAATFGNLMGYAFLLFYICAATYMLVAGKRGRMLLVVILGI
ncbi:MAG: hypothetical protein ACP5MK_03825, partial [Candidatus Micrarchaeia archaeon]